MNDLINLERYFYNTPNNHNSRYSDICEEDFQYMAIEAMENKDRILCFPYFRFAEKRDYIDIYIFDAMQEWGYRRFVLERGYALEEKEERLFLEYLHKDIWVAESLYTRLMDIMKDKYTEIHLHDYDDWRHSLMHIYFTFHRTGPYEILFKTNLNYFAAKLQRIEEFNIIGTTPEKILDVQLGMLRAMNSPFGVEILESVENRKWAKYLYSKYHNLIRGTMMNQYQWRYLKEQEEFGTAVDKKMYRYLSRFSDDMNYYIYRTYIEQKQIVDEYYKGLPQYPEVHELREHAATCDMIEWFIERERSIDRRMCNKARRYRDIYSYETSDYIILIPASLKELLKESQNQHNCLYRYALRVACDNTIILFMREKGREQQSLITVEVDGEGEIKQACGPYNRALNEKENLFLEEYAQAKNLVLWADSSQWLVDDEDWDEEED